MHRRTHRRSRWDSRVRSNGFSRPKTAKAVTTNRISDLLRLTTRAITLMLVLVAMGLRSPAAAYTPPEETALQLAADSAFPAVEPDLLRVLARDSDLPVRVIARLRVPEIPVDENQPLSRAALVHTLQANLASALTPLNPLLAEAQRQGHLLERHDLWIVHSLALTAQPDLVRRLIASPAVAELRLDHYEQYITPPEASADENTHLPETAWGVALMRAPEVWATLGISGTGSVVAIMDTGVDWLHPALSQNYRGNLGKGLFDHSASWYDSVKGGTYPYDGHGHGTHVAGTAVGTTAAAGTTATAGTTAAAGIGIAPAAQWVGVKVLSNEGYGYDSWIHAGFQWLLAPGGDPALAPDVVNDSWSSSNGASMEFAEDIERLRQAGIVAVFAAGNSGPSSRTVGSPASNPGVFAVGATDIDDDVAYFSSRGPSPWGEIKPTVGGPGVDVLSSLPGGIYDTKSGTSMATPHVAGLVALLRSADATLTVDDIARVITQTAVPLSTTLPNNESGWGRIDAFAAVAAVTHPGLITGTVKNTNNQTLPGAMVAAVPSRPTGYPAHTLTGDEGQYTLALVPSTYDVTASAFGHVPQIYRNVDVLTDTYRQLDFQLTPLPAGTLHGRVTVSGTNEVPTGTVVVRALGTPLTTTVNITGNYTLRLPTGQYTVEVRGLGYRVATAPLSITAGETTLYDFALTAIPTILLVDEGAWYYGSQIGHWEAALDALDVTYDLRRIKFPETDTPTRTTLLAYDVVLWSSPQGSPGLVEAGEDLESYLAHGGRLLLSGQDVAYYDGGRSYYYPGPQSYLTTMMGVAFSQDNAPSRQLTGLGPLSGITVTIEGGDGADNQSYPDLIRIQDPDRAEYLWQYNDQAWGGADTSICVPFRSLFFAFGFEAINDAGMRSEVMARSLDWLATPQPTTGLTLAHISDPLQIGLPGEAVTHTLRLRHIGYLGTQDTFTLTLGASSWPAAVSPATATLSPCQSITITAVVTIPEDAAINAQEMVTLTATSTLVPTDTVIMLHSKTPAPVLLVDDDRWYPMETYYTDALNAADVPFDVWDNADNLSGIAGQHSPTADVLGRYPVLVWFTGYDWYAPVLAEEEARLTDYLDGGGRLLLSSQDYLYDHTGTPLTRRLGVLSWDESLETTQAFGVPDHPAGGTWGPVALVFPFNNWTDTVEPVPGAVPVMRGQIAQPLGVATEGVTRTLFYGIPLETLRLDVRTHILSQGIGWLSPLGTSRWAFTPTVPLPGARVTSTLILNNDATSPHLVTLSHTLPASLTLISDTLSPTLHYDTGSRAITWTGQVEAENPVTFTWVVSVAGHPGDAIQPVPLTLTLGLPTWQFHFDRYTTLNGTGADLSASQWLSPEWSAVRAGSPLTLAFELRNTGPGAVEAGKVHLWLTDVSTPITATEPPTRGWGIAGWQGALAPAETVVLTVPVRVWIWDRPLRADAVMEDGAGQRWERRLWLTVEPWRFYLPVVTKQE